MKGHPFNLGYSYIVAFSIPAPPGPLESDPRYQGIEKGADYKFFAFLFAYLITADEAMGMRNVVTTLGRDVIIMIG